MTDPTQGSTGSNKHVYRNIYTLGHHKFSRKAGTFSGWITFRENSRRDPACKENIKHKKRSPRVASLRQSPLFEFVIVVL